MKPIDFAKAAGIATLVLVLNVLIAIIVVFGYSMVELGHPKEFYDAAALRIAPWCSYIAGTALCFGAGYWCARRRPERNGFLFAAAFVMLYAIIDGAMVEFVGIFALNFVISMFAKLFAAPVGVFLAQTDRFK